MNVKYRPLPPFLTIKESEIDGLGLFATDNIVEDTYLGVSHISHKEGQHGYMRTPLGGFVNHSNDPNCRVLDGYGEYHMITNREIKDGEELTLKYHLYDPTL